MKIRTQQDESQFWRSKKEMDWEDKFQKYFKLSQDSMDASAVILLLELWFFWFCLLWKESRIKKTLREVLGVCIMATRELNWSQRETKKEVRSKRYVNDTTNRWIQRKYSAQSSHCHKRMIQNWVDVTSFQICLIWNRMMRIDTDIDLIYKSIYRYSFISTYLSMGDCPRDDDTSQ